MKTNPTTLIRKTSSRLLIVTAIVAFVFGLGFMTGFYKLFYDGTNEMYLFYKDVQVLNNLIFDSALYLVVFSLLLIPLDVFKKELKLYSIVIVVVLALSTVINSLAVFEQTTIFKDVYTAIDFSVIESYTESTFVFTFSYIVFTIASLLSAGLLGVTLYDYLMQLKERKLNE
jgi:hypothetical protein